MKLKSGLLMTLSFLLLAGCNDNGAGSGDGDNGGGSGSASASTGLQKAAAMSYNETYIGSTNEASPEGEGSLTAMADAAFLLWNLHQVQRGIDDTTALKEIYGSEFDVSTTPWEFGFNGTPCTGGGGSFNVQSGGVGAAAGSVELDEFCFVDGDLTDDEQMVVNGTYEWSDSSFNMGTSGDAVTISHSYRVEFTNLAVRWRDRDWVLNGVSATEADSTERAFALDVTDDNGVTYRIQRVVRVDADTRFSEAIWHPDHGRLTFKSTSQDLGTLTGEWAVFGGVCDASAYLSAEGNDTELTVEVAAKVDGTCEQYELQGSDAAGNTVQSGPFNLLGTL